MRNLLIVFMMLGVVWGNAQTQESSAYSGAEVSDLVYPYFIDVDLSSLPLIETWQPGDGIKEIPRRADGPGSDFQAPPRVDPLLALQENATAVGNSLAPPILNFNAQPFRGTNPPDTVGDVGLNYYIQAINGGVAGIGAVPYMIYNKSNGSVAAGPFALSNFAPCNSQGDPIVLYDELANRWLLAAFGNGFTICVLISATSNPITGGWHQYSFPAPNFPDYPKFAVWHNAYIMTTNEGGPSPIYALDRNQMLAGNPATAQRMTIPDLTGFSFQALTPADVDGNPPPNDQPAYLMRHVDTEPHQVPAPPGVDYLEVWEYAIDWLTPANTTLTGPTSIAVSEFDSSLCGLTSFSCFPQPGSAFGLDPLREVIMLRLQYRNFDSYQTLVGNFVTDVDGTDHGGIRWFELRKSAPATNWSLYQEGTYAPDANHRWMGAIAMDENGNIAVGYNVSSSTLYPSLRYTGRLSSDPLGTFPQGELSIASGTASNASNRYGDYAQMSIDPSDGCTFWFTGMYNPASQYQTRIASFKFDACDCAAASPTNLTAEANVDNQIELNWSPTTGGSSYDVFRAIGDCSSTNYQQIASGLLATTFTDTTVSGEATYAYVVSAFDDALNCQSTVSQCVDVTATGICFLIPDFSGLASVVDPQAIDCALDLEWAAGSDPCNSTTLTYNIYRSQDPGFLPGPGNLLVGCFPDTTYTDLFVGPGIEYFYVVRAEDGTGTGMGPCNGNEDSNTIRLSGIASGPEQTQMQDDMESGPSNWTPVSGPNDPGGTTGFELLTGLSSSPTHAWFVANSPDIKDQTLQTTSPVVFPSDDSAQFAFNHHINSEATYDGGVLEYSTDGGASWFDILQGDGLTIPANPARFIENGYNSVLNAGSGNPLAGRQAWSGANINFETVVVDLTDFLDHSVFYRWRFGCDNVGDAEGWYLDDMEISSQLICKSGLCPDDFSPWPVSDIIFFVDCINSLLLP